MSANDQTSTEGKMGNFYLLSVEDQKRESFERLRRYIHDVVQPYHVKGVTEVTPDEILIEHDREKLEGELFERTGIKAEYVVENRPVHL